MLVSICRRFRNRCIISMFSSNRRWFPLSLVFLLSLSIYSPPWKKKNNSHRLYIMISVIWLRVCSYLKRPHKIAATFFLLSRCVFAFILAFLIIAGWIEFISKSVGCCFLHHIRWILYDDKHVCMRAQWFHLEIYETDILAIDWDDQMFSIYFTSIFRFRLVCWILRLNFSLSLGFFSFLFACYFIIYFFFFCV